MKPTIVANWKMQLGVADSVRVAQEVHDRLNELRPEVNVVICPSFLPLASVAAVLNDGRIRLGAQDVFWSEKGPFTGEESPLALREVGAGYVIVGHSERRQLGETDTDVARKTLAALAHGLMPIICVGESADDRAQGRQEVVVQEQLNHVFRSTPPPTRGQTIFIAYEPIWAIGTGEAANPDQAEAMRALIRRNIFDRVPPELLDSSFRILYGGSVDAANIQQYVGPDRYDGALVGGASLQADTFTPLIMAVAPTRGTAQGENV